MRVALVHDWLTGMRGGEKVLERVAAMFPDAPIYTLVWKRGSVSPALEAHPIHTSFLQRLPDAAARYRWYLPLFPRAIESFRLEGYDAVISLSHAVARSVIVPPATMHLSYIFTPMRYVWDLEDQYFPPGRFPWPLSAYVRATCARLRAWDRATSQRPAIMLTLSRHVADRIERHYGRSVGYIYPPVNLARFPLDPEARPGDYYLLAGALAPYKRGDLALAACRKLGRKLIVVGSGQDSGRLRRGAGDDVEFVGWASDDDLASLYARARALLYPGEEDFGIVPVEAMASGCPVIAFGRGGAVETVGRGADAESLARVAAGGEALVPGGVLFGTQNADALAHAMTTLEARTFDRARLRAQAEPFDAARFDEQFRVAFDRAFTGWQETLARYRAAGVPI
jgi:glycosyltransferase involved in cell wall biosynthesis